MNSPQTTSPHVDFDVAIIGAGISGIAAAHYLKAECPSKSYAILEGRDAIGGTWDLFRYPGIRSDSDMYTLGFSFYPWMGDKAIAEGADIRDYVVAAARAEGIDRDIRFRTRVERASFSSEQSLWTIFARDTESGQAVHYTCRFLWACTGYYHYESGYTPELPGTERFAGRIVHPQSWPEDLDYAGKRIIVIGSGATAMTLVPALAEQAGHVTMLQRSPTYVVSVPDHDPITDWLKKRFPAQRAAAMIRWKNVALGTGFYQYTRHFPKHARKVLLRWVRQQLPAGFDVEKHFTPSYNPWDQRLCVVPQGDLFEAIRDGKVSVETDEISTFTERGIALKSGVELDADIIITATGLRLQFLGGATLDIDGDAVEPNQSMLYKGMMLSDVPNFVVCSGYTNASWTLKVELTCQYVCALLNLIDQRGFHQFTAHRDDSVETRPAIDLQAGYLARGLSLMPTQGAKRPWRLHQNYLLDRLTLLHTAIEDDTLELR